MAKKKKSSKKKVSEAPVTAERSPFWSYTAATLLILIALFALLGGFGTGGTLPKGLFGAAYWLFGYASWLTPVALVYCGVYKFTSDDHRVPLSNLFSMALLLAFASSWFHVAFATKLADGTFHGGHGGNIGSGMGGAVLTMLDKIPASLLFFVCTVFAFLFAFGISPKVLLAPFKRREREDEEDGLEALKNKAAQSGFKLNEGVPVEHHGTEVTPQPSPRLTSLRNTAQKLAPQETHAALTAASDPDWKFPGVSLLDNKQDKADAGNVEANAKIIR